MIPKQPCYSFGRAFRSFVMRPTSKGDDTVLTQVLVPGKSVIDHNNIVIYVGQLVDITPGYEIEFVQIGERLV